MELENKGRLVTAERGILLPVRSINIKELLFNAANQSALNNCRTETLNYFSLAINPLFGVAVTVILIPDQAHHYRQPDNRFLPLSIGQTFQHHTSIGLVAGTPTSRIETTKSDYYWEACR